MNPQAIKICHVSRTRGIFIFSVAVGTVASFLSVRQSIWFTSFMMF